MCVCVSSQYVVAHTLEALTELQLMYPDRSRPEVPPLGFLDDIGVCDVINVAKRLTHIFPPRGGLGSTAPHVLHVEAVANTDVGANTVTSAVTSSAAPPLEATPALLMRVLVALWLHSYVRHNIAFSVCLLWCGCVSAFSCFRVGVFVCFCSVSEKMLQHQNLHVGVSHECSIVCFWFIIMSAYICTRCCDELTPPNITFMCTVG